MCFLTFIIPSVSHFVIFGENFVTNVGRPNRKFSYLSSHRMQPSSEANSTHIAEETMANYAFGIVATLISNYEHRNQKFNKIKNMEI